MDIIKDLLEKVRNTFNKQMVLLKTEVIKHKELNKRLLRNEVTTLSFSDSMYEDENINSMNERQQQQQQQQPVVNAIQIQLRSINNMKLLWDDNKHLKEMVVFLSSESTTISLLKYQYRGVK